MRASYSVMIGVNLTNTLTDITYIEHCRMRTSLWFPTRPLREPCSIKSTYFQKTTPFPYATILTCC